MKKAQTDEEKTWLEQFAPLSPEFHVKTDEDAAAIMQFVKNDLANALESRRAEQKAFDNLRQLKRDNSTVEEEEAAAVVLQEVRRYYEKYGERLRNLELKE